MKVNIGRWISIDEQGHQYQRSWASKGYDSAWVPAKCGMVASGLEEWCVYDPKRMTNIKIVKPNLKTVSCHYSKWFQDGCKWNDLECFRLSRGPIIYFIEGRSLSRYKWWFCN